MPGLGADEAIYTELKRYAIGLLSRQELTQKLLAQRLSRHFNKISSSDGDVDLSQQQLEPLLNQLLMELTEAGWQSDERYVEGFVRNRLSKGHGLQRIQREARQKHIPEQLLAVHLDLDGDQWLARGRAVYIKKYGDDPCKEMREKQRRLRFLQYRGYSYQQCLLIVEQTE